MSTILLQVGFGGNGIALYCSGQSFSVDRSNLALKIRMVALSGHDSSPPLSSVGSIFELSWQMTVLPKHNLI